MKRIEFEEKSRGIIERYVTMLDAMNSSEVKGIIADDYSANSYAYFKITEISKLWDLEERPLWNINGGVCKFTFSQDRCFYCF